jgi:protein arginine kinase
MNKSVKLEKTAGWFSQAGNMNDVIISSRVRLSRNINGHLFPGKMKEDDEAKVNDKIINAFNRIDESGNFGVSEIRNIKPIDRKIMLERNFLSQDFILHLNKKIIMSEDNLSTCVLNDKDHIRLTVFNGGLEIKKCAEQSNRIDRKLESELDYAVSFEFGYLNTEVNNLGTGMRASVMMHLPALVRTNLIEKALKAVVQIGFTVKGFMGDEEHSLGSMYQIANQFTIGYSEEEFIEKLENLAMQIAGYESKARTELIEKKRAEIEDAVYRAYGLLTNCRLLTSNEAINNLSLVRMGISMGLIDLPIEICNSLIFLTQKSHIQKIMKDPETSADEMMINYTRSEFVKEVLKNKKV